MITKIKEFLSAPFLLGEMLIINQFKRNIDYIEETFYYGKDKKQYIIFISPKGDYKRKSILFFVHGGGWRSGCGKQFKYVGRYFASFGYATVIVGYRLAPKYRYPLQIEDVIKALIYGDLKAKEYNIYCDRFILIGHSAGAHLVSLLSYGNLLKQINFNRERIKGVISIGGPINFCKCKNRYINKFLQDFLGSEKNKKEADPFLYLSKESCIPILCIHGEKDPLIDVQNSITFVEKINKIHKGLGQLWIIKKGLHTNVIKLFFGKIKGEEIMLKWMEKIENK